MPTRAQIHQPTTIKAPERRGTAAERGYDGKWRKARLHYLARNPLCVICDSNGIVRAANVVDHITPHKGNSGLFWDSRNWQPLCKMCHDEKTGMGR
jgi:5-methylcytosine-specific restriction protein A